MRYDNKALADILSAEYVLGTLKGAARRRFEQLLRERTDWARTFNWWELHIHLLADTAAAVKPSNHVWKNIERRLFSRKTQRISSWWKSLAILSTALATSLAILLILQVPQTALESTPTAIALLATEKSEAGWLLNEIKKSAGTVEIKAISLPSLQTKPNNDFELWLLPADKSKPISLGLLPQKGFNTLKVPTELIPLMALGALAVSLEPIGGSSTGQPTGAVLYQGKLTQT